MPVPDGLESLEGRLGSFEVTQPEPARKTRRSSALSKSQAQAQAQNTVVWPHVKPSPDQLANAGFYYCPSEGNPDNVTCFHCRVTLDGWEEEDDPMSEHLTHSPECPWALEAIAMASKPAARKGRTSKAGAASKKAKVTKKKAAPKKATASVASTRRTTRDSEAPEEIEDLNVDVIMLDSSQVEEIHDRSHNPEHIDVPVEKPVRAKPASKSRRMPSRTTRGSLASVVSVVESIVPPSPELDLSLDLGKEDSGNETDASMASMNSKASKASTRARPTKRSSAMKKGRVAKKKGPTKTKKKVPPPSPPPPKEITPEPTPILISQPTRNVLTPSPSPQPSDAENQPPSSRPSLPSQQPIRIPLAAATPNTSPSKRNIIHGNGLKTTQPWTAVDLETIFLQSSPSKASMENDRERMLADIIEGVKGRLSAAEESMSVEQWILHNATLAEDSLRLECERVVGVFEREGNRAIQALEGLEVMVE